MAYMIDQQAAESAKLRGAWLVEHLARILNQALPAVGGPRPVPTTIGTEKIAGGSSVEEAVRRLVSGTRRDDPARRPMILVTFDVPRGPVNVTSYSPGSDQTARELAQRVSDAAGHAVFRVLDEYSVGFEGEDRRA